MATVNLKGCPSLLPLPPTQNIQLLGEGTELGQPPREDIVHRVCYCLEE